MTLLFLVLCSVVMTMAQEDKKGSKDHPLFTRMPNYRIRTYEENQFDNNKFKDPDTKQMVTVEGKKYVIEYESKDRKNFPSSLQIARNHNDAIVKIGGKSIEGSNPGQVYLKVIKDNMEIWAEVRCFNGGAVYRLTIIEKQAMKQDVVANAETLAGDINTSGKVAVYGIYFDTNKAEIKPESDPTLKEIAKLMTNNSGLKLYVVGHTDNVGELNYNMKLSQQRAEAVVQALVSKYAVPANRLKGQGVGPLAPVASNKTEEGKAKNRRVELVEQ
jgi:outer membrane protein OmpA-like peptidoglycan-associated protein